MGVMQASHGTKAADAPRDAAIEHLMDAYGTAVLRMCYAYLKDHALAEDAAQDAFVKAYRGYGSYQGARAMSERAWLMRIAINTCKDYRRTAWFRHVDRHVPAEEARELQTLTDPSDGALRDAVLALPIRLREVVLLHYYQGLDYHEIAQALGVSRSTVYARLKRAREKLRGALEGWDEA